MDDAFSFFFFFFVTYVTKNQTKNPEAQYKFEELLLVFKKTPTT